MSGDIFIISTGGELLVSSEWRPKMLLIPIYRADPLRKNSLAQNSNSYAVENLTLKRKCDILYKLNGGWGKTEGMYQNHLWNFLNLRFS